jgi:3-keto-L-gulonate-6-phosphate decarboxylase
MDLKGYYRKVREVTEGLPEPCVVVSQQTADGGKAGMRTEVPRKAAARMIVNGTARAATEEEASTFREANEEAKQVAEQLAAAGRMQVTVIPSYELRNLKGPGRSARE